MKTTIKNLNSSKTYLLVVVMFIAMCSTAYCQDGVRIEQGSPGNSASARPRSTIGSGSSSTSSSSNSGGVPKQDGAGQGQYRGTDGKNHEINDISGVKFDTKSSSTSSSTSTNSSGTSRSSSSSSDHDSYSSSSGSSWNGSDRWSNNYSAGTYYSDIYYSYNATTVSRTDIAIAAGTNLLNSTNEKDIDDFFKEYAEYSNTDLYNKLKAQKKNINDAESYNYNLARGNLDKSFLDNYDALPEAVKNMINKTTLEARKNELAMKTRVENLDKAIAAFDINDFSKANQKKFDKLFGERIAIAYYGGAQYIKNRDLFALYIEKRALDNLQNVPLSRDFGVMVKANLAAQNKAPWEKISEQANNPQRLLTMLGFLNTSNNGVLPKYVAELSDYWIFRSTMVTDEQTIERSYWVSKNLEKIELIENEGKFSTKFVDEKAASINLGFAEVSQENLTWKLGVASVDVKKQAGKVLDANGLLKFDADIELFKTEMYKQMKVHRINIAEDGSVLIGGDLTGKLGLTSSITSTVGTSGLEVGASIEVASVTAGWTPHSKPMMEINDDMSVNFRQAKAELSVKTGIKADASAGLSLKDKFDANLNLPLLSIKLGLERPDIDGSLKQIPPELTKSIIYSYSQNTQNVVSEVKLTVVPESNELSKNFDPENIFFIIIDEEKKQEKVNNMIKKWQFAR
jgi:hypothetical protein